MSHFLDRLSYFTQEREAFSDGHGRVTREDRSLGGRLSPALAARQDRALDPRRQLHRFVQLEDLRQGRHRHLGDAADRLSAHASGPAQPRAARLLARGFVFLVHVQRQPGEIPDGARAPAARLARGAQVAGAGRGLGDHRRDRRRHRRTTSRAAAWAASCARAGTKPTRSSPRPMSTPSRSMARTAWSASRRFRRCRWCPTPPAAATCR